MSNKKIDYDEITKLVGFLEEKNLTHFELEVEGFKIKISRALTSVPAAERIEASAMAAQPEPEKGPAHPDPNVPEPGNGLHFITSPMVGTFYRAPDPTSSPFVEIGDEVKKSQTLCIIEAMKLMNEIESDIEGVITEIYVENGRPVEYGQKLFAIQPVSA
jgi:acetyl-CoA carboxylase biotin carboxyl carrier protein